MKKRRQDKTKLAAKMAAYAATALSALTVAYPASATVVHNGPHNVIVPVNGNVTINLDEDTNNDFRFSLTTKANTWSLSATGLNSGQFIAYKGVENLSSGYSIKNTLGKDHHWISAPNSVAGSSSYGGFGQFTNTPGYMGVRFHTAQCRRTNWNYGWISIEADGSDGKPGTVQIVDWAYESDCNTAIKAGATTSSPTTPPKPVSVPTLDEWGMLALATLLSGTAIRRMKKGQAKA